MANTGGQDYNGARPPSPGDDASPFLLRVYVTRRGQWRPLSDFDQPRRPSQDEFKLYVWRSTTLRSLAHLLHSALPSLSHPHSPHSFRLVYYNPHRSLWSSRELGRDITRVSPLDVSDRLGSEEAREVLGFARDRLEGWEQQQQLERGRLDGMIQIGDCGIGEGDVLECLIGSSPFTATSYAAAGTASSSSNRSDPIGLGPNHAPRDRRRDVSGGGFRDSGVYRDRRTGEGRGIEVGRGAHRW